MSAKRTTTTNFMVFMFGNAVRDGEMWSGIPDSVIASVFFCSKSRGSVSGDFCDSYKTLRLNVRTI
jgi:hypothetical protein